MLIFLQTLLLEFEVSERERLRKQENIQMIYRTIYNHNMITVGRETTDLEITDVGTTGSRPTSKGRSHSHNS